MKILPVIVFFCSSVFCVKTSAALQVRGHVGGDVSIHCSVSWTKDNSSQPNMYFCRGVCSRENILIETQRKRSGVTWRGRYSIEVNRGYGVFNVTIRKLKRTDAGQYCCGVEKNFNELHQAVNLVVLDASSVPAGSAGSLPHGSLQSTTDSSPAALTLPSTAETNKRATISLTDTTVVIIISVSLALLVCALIPLVFYGHWRSNAGQSRPEANKGEANYCEENTERAASLGEVKLQSVEPQPESSAQDPAQYATVYQALDPQALN